MASEPEDRIDTEKEDEPEDLFRSVGSGARRVARTHLDENGLDRHMKLRFRQQQVGRRTAQRDLGPSRFSLSIPRYVLDKVREEVLGIKPENFGIASVEDFRHKQLGFALGNALRKDQRKE